MSAPLLLYLTIPDFHHISETGQHTLDTNILNKRKVKGWVITHLQNSGILLIFLNPRGQTTAAAAAHDVQGVLFRTVTGASQRLEAAWNDRNTNVETGIVLCTNHVNIFKITKNKRGLCKNQIFQSKFSSCGMF